MDICCFIGSILFYVALVGQWVPLAALERKLGSQGQAWERNLQTVYSFVLLNF